MGLHDEQRHADAHQHVAGEIELARARRADLAAHLQQARRDRRNGGQHGERDHHFARQKPVQAAGAYVLLTRFE
jgi:hypothetical protein